MVDVEKNKSYDTLHAYRSFCLVFVLVFVFGFVIMEER